MLGPSEDLIAKSFGGGRFDPNSVNVEAEPENLGEGTFDGFVELQAKPVVTLVGSADHDDATLIDGTITEAPEQLENTTGVMPFRETCEFQSALVLASCDFLDLRELNDTASLRACASEQNFSYVVRPVRWP